MTYRFNAMFTIFKWNSILLWTVFSCACSPIRKLLDDPDPDIRQTAWEALDKIEGGVHLE